MQRCLKYQQLPHEPTAKDEKTTSYHETAIAHTLTKKYEDTGYTQRSSIVDNTTSMNRSDKLIDITISLQLRSGVRSGL